MSFALAFGFLLLHVVERTLALHHAHEGEYSAHHHPEVGLASTIALVLHSFLDGVGIGLAFQVNSTVGLAVAFAVIAHDFADGLNTVSIMVSHGNSDLRAKVMLGLDAAAPADRCRQHAAVQRCRTGCWRSTWRSSAASCSTWRPTTSCPRRTRGTRPG